MECQHHNNCGGFCETTQEQEFNLCSDCLEAYHEREADAEELRVLRLALAQIAQAAGLDCTDPQALANKVCARLRAAE